MSSHLRSRLADLPPALARHPHLKSLAWILGHAPTGGRQAYLAVVARNLILGHALDEALGCLLDAGVPVQPLKGALFIETLYGGELGARPMSDLDLLVPAGSAARARAALLRLGYEDTGAGRARFTARYTHHDVLRRGPVPVELHHRLCHDLAVDGDSAVFFRDQVNVKWRSGHLAVACPELQLFYILLHAATHALRYSPVWVVDAVLQVCAAPRVSWEVIEHEARQRRAFRLLHAAARYVNDYFPGTFPRALPPRSLRDVLLTAALGHDDTPIPYGPGARSLVVRALLTDRRTDAVRVIAEKAWLRLIEVGERATAGA
ncbi:MAG: nucleotidyltransferase family protein [Deltaproteobacteria bacterium]|nr:nucleotidyltransferase family protein [Deltaproteobacteria bacterium]